MFEWSKKVKLKPEYVIIAILFVAIILISNVSISKKNTNNLTDTENFVLQTELKLKSSIEKINGVKKAAVSITISEGVKTIIAEDVKQIQEGEKATYTSSPVLVSGKPIVLGEIYPEIAGVVVICNCSDSLAIRMSVLDVVTMMLNIPCDRVRIIIQ